jgi:hypothetical protein
MGLFDNIFGGGNRERTRDESSVQADINRGLKESGGKFTPEINSLVAERDRARSGGASSGGLGSLSAGLGRAVDTVRSIPGNFARDVRMGTSANVFANRDKQAENLASRGYSQREIQDYFARTDATIARDAAQEAARQNEGPSDAEMAAVRMGAEDIPPEDQMPRYRNPFGTMPGAPGQMPGSPNALTVFPQPPEITPDMRREALRIFESQRGAGQVPYQMMPYQQGLGSLPPPQGLSPAFQYAAQNYQRLGGAQRLMDRPMEMMSVAERQRINDMAQGMAGMQRPTMFPGKGNVAQQPEALSRLRPLINQMGLASLRGPGMPPQ